MEFFVWQGVRRPHGKPCNNEQRSQAKKARRVSVDSTWLKHAKD
jgi:hypothetical protein